MTTGTAFRGIHRLPSQTSLLPTQMLHDAVPCTECLILQASASCTIGSDDYTRPAWFKDVCTSPCLLSAAQEPAWQMGGCSCDLCSLTGAQFLGRFVTKAELEKLGIGHLVGTPLLRAYMHGFFLHNRLWNKARAIAEPFMYDSYRKERVSEKLEAERKSRIGLKRKLPKVRPPARPPARLPQACSEQTLDLLCLVLVP